jgi:4-alpha-glucanotransferase
MVITQFGFDPQDADGPHRLDHHVRRSVAYTGTHDAAPVAGWWKGASDAERAEAERQFAAAGIDGSEPHWGLIELTMRSVAEVAVVQAQDILGLGDEARMNTPGVEGGNWTWRADPGVFSSPLADELRATAATTGRDA